MSRFNGIVNLSQDGNVIYDNLLVKGILNNDKLIYKENDITVTILLKDNTIEMERNNHDYCINLTFDDKNTSVGTYYLTHYNQSLELQIKTLSFEHNNDSINIEYILLVENEKIGHFNFSLKLEVSS